MGDDEKPRLSWREIDQRRSGGRKPRADEPRGRAARAERVRQTKEALSEADALFSFEKGGQEGARLAKEMRDAHGTEGFVEACRAYRDALGIPDEPALLALLLDTGETELVLPALEALLAAKNAGSLELSAGMKSQLRILAQDRDDEVAGISEELLED